MTEEEFAAMQMRRGVGAGYPIPTPSNSIKPPKRQKYGNKRVQIDGIWFDSQHEANIYMELMLRVRAGELKCVCRQVQFDLPGGIVYKADFVTIRPDKSVEGVYDAKSEITKKDRTYINKKKQMKACYDIDIIEV